MFALSVTISRNSRMNSPTYSIVIVDLEDEGRERCTIWIYIHTFCGVHSMNYSGVIDPPFQSFRQSSFTDFSTTRSPASAPLPPAPVNRSSLRRRPAVNCESSGRSRRRRSCCSFGLYLTSSVCPIHCRRGSSRDALSS